METKIYKMGNRATEGAMIGEAARVIREGGLAAFPTETVYGLGADALNPEAADRKSVV